MKNTEKTEKSISFEITLTESEILELIEIFKKKDQAVDEDKSWTRSELAIALENIRAK